VVNFLAGHDHRDEPLIGWVFAGRERMRMRNRRDDPRIWSAMSVPRRTVDRCLARYVGAATSASRTSTIAVAPNARCVLPENACDTAVPGRPGGGPSFPSAFAGSVRQAMRPVRSGPTMNVGTTRPAARQESRSGPATGHSPRRRLVCQPTLPACTDMDVALYGRCNRTGH
jgi:hypothetical protein